VPSIAFFEELALLTNAAFSAQLRAVLTVLAVLARVTRVRASTRRSEQASRSYTDADC